MAAVREALGKFTLSPQIDFDTEGSIDIPVQLETNAAPPRVTIDPHYNPFNTRSSYTPHTTPQTWEALYQSLPATPPLEKEPPQEPPLLSSEEADICTPWQYNGKYIIVTTDRGLLFINQHRAHTAIQYQLFIDQLQQTRGSSQQLLFPEVISLSLEDIVLLEQLLADLHIIGFEIDRFSPDSFSIQGVPSQLTDTSAIPTLQYILHSVRERGANTQEEWRAQIALSLAEKTAIPYGKTLTIEEMRDLIKRLFQLGNLRTPKGKKILHLLSDEDINKLF